MTQDYLSQTIDSVARPEVMRKTTRVLFFPPFFASVEIEEIIID